MSWLRTTSSDPSQRPDWLERLEQERFHNDASWQSLTKKQIKIEQDVAFLKAQVATLLTIMGHKVGKSEPD
jgi:hypothetical protein